MDAPRTPFEQRSAVERALRIFLATFASLWFAAFAFPAVQRFIFNRPYPYNTFLFNPAARFWDFTVFAPRFAHWDNNSGQFFAVPGFPFTYPAPLLLAQLPFYKLTSSPLRVYLLTVLFFASAAAFAAILPQARKGCWLSVAAILCLSIFSFPLLYLLDRANIEGFVWIASALGLFCFLRRHFTTAAILIGLAASMKLFPGLLLLLFIRHRRDRDLVTGVAACGIFTLASLWLVGPTIASATARIAFGVDYLRTIQIFEYRPAEIGFDHSLFAVVKQLAHLFIRELPRLNAILPRIYLVYAGSAAAAFLALYFARLRHLPLLNQLLVLSTLSVTLPFVSYDYTLVHMSVPCAAFILYLADLYLASGAGQNHVPLTTRQMLAFLLPFAVIFTPQSYILYNGIGFAGQVKTLALLTVVASALSIRLPWVLFGEAQTTQFAVQPVAVLISTAPSSPTK